MMRERIKREELQMWEQRLWDQMQRGERTHRQQINFDDRTQKMHEDPPRHPHPTRVNIDKHALALAALRT